MSAITNYIVYLFLVDQFLSCTILGQLGYCLAPCNSGKKETTRQKIKRFLFAILMCPFIVMTIWSLFGLMSAISVDESNVFYSLVVILNTIGENQGLRVITAIFSCVIGVERWGKIIQGIGQFLFYLKVRR